ncbi:hypothetical protein DFP72DRAFT_1080520 [Ephemerocybe angulata]|uniref:CxC2-like cysteine cluster KDZ transposase-associated domain-containing protein n=1 Tax=Ephemerocybe angulata TaxID=980116 RepID=A0A8H6HBS0_9AGAR|nr:hypothetical protein DFP72DRAFT_1080520 [Tulosesus angulatus]
MPTKRSWGAASYDFESTEEVPSKPSVPSSSKRNKAGSANDTGLNQAVVGASQHGRRDISRKVESAAQAPTKSLPTPRTIAAISTLKARATTATSRTTARASIKPTTATTSTSHSPATLSLLEYEYRPPDQFDDSSPDFEHDASAGNAEAVSGAEPLAASEEWAEHHREEYLREMLRLEGRGDFINAQHCWNCKTPGAMPEYRCRTCFGDDLVCGSCVVQLHSRMPFHFIERWTGSRFDKTTLKHLGLRIQLGHLPGEACYNPKPSHNDDFVVLDSTGIHEVGLSFCECELAAARPVQLLRHRLFPGTGDDPRSAATFGVLKLFHLLSFESKGSHEEFYNAVVRLTSNVDPSVPRDRYHEFIVMVTQWRHLKMLKRNGRAHSLGGVAGTDAGECAVRCPACPQAGINLPPGWDLVHPDRRWLYRLFLAIDGNFRLKRRKVSSDEKDPGLNGGWAFFVEEKAFREFIKLRWDEKQERSTCVAHDAVDKPDKEARGLAASGVVAVVCTRHEFKIPNGVGDLQKGERYINVDYVLFSGLRIVTAKDLVISYDIICQWCKNLMLRIPLLPSLIHPFPITSLTFLIPKFHLPAHVEYCHRTFSYNLTKGVGRSDGEAPERGWARVNAVAKSTAEMGPGTRRDTLDDHFNDGNWKKTCNLARSLHVKATRAASGKAKHEKLFAEFKESIPSKYAQAWETAVEAWESNPIGSANPYEVEVKGMSERDIRLRLAIEAELEDAAASVSRPEGEVASSIHPSLFVAQGIQLEDDQHRLRQAVSRLSNHPTSKQLATLAERSNSVRRRIATWFETQKVLMPEADQERRRLLALETNANGSPSLEVYDIHLLLPSALPRSASTAPLCLFEAELRKGQAYDALADMRRYLRLRSYLLKQKDLYTRGVAANTRANVAISRAQEGVNWAAAKYRRVRKLLSSLCPVADDPAPLDDPTLDDPTAWRRDLLPLGDNDVRGLSEGLFGESDGTRTMSWIWFSASLNSAGGERENIETDLQLQDALRIEYLKTRARAMRWREEVELLDEEKRRTREYFRWKANWWRSRTTSGIGGEGREYDEGFSAFALDQARVYDELAHGCEERWKATTAGSVGAKKKASKQVEVDDMEDDDDDVLDFVEDYD